MANENPDAKIGEFYTVGPLRGKVIADSRRSRWRGKHKLVQVQVTAPAIEGYGIIEHIVRIYPGKRDVGHDAMIENTYNTRYNEVELHRLAEKVTSEAVTRLGRIVEKVVKAGTTYLPRPQARPGFCRIVEKVVKAGTTPDWFRGEMSKLGESPEAWESYTNRFYEATCNQLRGITGGIVPKTQKQPYGYVGFEPI